MLTSFVTKSSGIRELQIPGGEMWQSNKAMGVSSATACLFQYVMDNLEPIPLKMLELGSGSGVLSIMLARHFLAWQITGIEVQENLHHLAVHNANHLRVPVSFICSDLNYFMAEQKFNIIVSNPPWQKLGSGLLSPLYERAVSRSEVLCNLAQVLGCCKRNLFDGGSAILLYPVSRKDEVLQEAASACLEIQAIQPADNGSLIFHLSSRINL